MIKILLIEPVSAGIVPILVKKNQMFSENCQVARIIQPFSFFDLPIFLDTPAPPS